MLSARSGEALDAAARRLARHLERHPTQSLADVAYTLQEGRTAFGYRRAIVCEDTRGGHREAPAGRAPCSPLRPIS